MSLTSWDIAWRRILIQTTITLIMACEETVGGHLRLLSPLITGQVISCRRSAAWETDVVDGRKLLAINNQSECSRQLAFSHPIHFYYKTAKLHFYFCIEIFCHIYNLTHNQMTSIETLHYGYVNCSFTFHRNVIIPRRLICVGTVGTVIFRRRERHFQTSFILQHELLFPKKISRRPRLVACELIPFEAL